MLIRRVAAATAAAALAAVVGFVPSASAAESADAYITGGETWFESDCKGNAPVVVGSDATAQSDLYSAVTLAAGIDSDCVVLAGARDSDMAAEQRKRLDASETGGYVVGGVEAVPAAKISGRNLVRLAGKDRWHTALLVGAAIAGRDVTGAAAAPPAPDAAGSKAAAAGAAGAYIAGGEGWFGSDCDGDTPIVVGSDADAQSDLYSAVTLAGLIRSDCVILAGARGGEMAAEQRKRLDAAAAGGYVVGGVDAVPAAKTAGRDVIRFDGKDRWATAQLIAAHASGYTAIAAGANHTCAIRTDRGVTCWGDNQHQQNDAPDGTYASIAAGDGHTCAIRTNGTIACWGNGTTLRGLSGTYTAIAAGANHTCAIATNGTISCWGNHTELEDVSGTFTAIAAGANHTCAIATNGTISCWGNNQHKQANAPSGTFTAIAAGANHTCAIATNGTISCWGNNQHKQANAPSGTFTAIAAGANHTCAIATNGTISCWGNHTELEDVSGTFTAIAAGANHTCAIKSDRGVTCWGDNAHGQTNAP